MTSYRPPTENLAIFNESVFLSNDEPLTFEEAQKYFLRYPYAQGTENLQAINVNGLATHSNDIDMTGNDLLNVNQITSSADLFLNPVGSIDANGKTLNMTGGEIHNCPLIHSQNNNDITIEGKGTGDIVFETNNSERMRIDDTGAVKILSQLPYPTSYYVSKSGSDLIGTGSQSNPYLTIQAAINAGSSLYNAFNINIDRGTYAEDLIIGDKSINFLGIPDWDIPSTFIIGFNGVILTGSVTFNGVSANTTCSFQNLAFVFSSGKQIFYNGGSYMVFSNVHMQSNNTDNIPFLTTNSGYIYMTDCRLIKNVANTSSLIYIGSTSQGTFIMNRTEIQGQSSSAAGFIRLSNGSSIIMGNSSALTLNAGTAAFVYLEGATAGTYTYNLCIFTRTGTASPLIKNNLNIGVNPNITFVYNRIIMNVSYTGVLFFENARATTTMTINLNSNNYIQNTGTTIDYNNLYGGAGLVVKNAIAEISNINMNKADINDTNKVNFNSTTGDNGFIGIDANQLTIKSATDNINIEPGGSEIYTSKIIKSTDGANRNTYMTNSSILVEDAGIDSYYNIDVHSLGKPVTTYHHNGADIYIEQNVNELSTSGDLGNMIWDKSSSTLTTPFTVSNSISSNLNTDLTIQSQGTGDIILKTGGTNRLTISDTGVTIIPNDATNTNISYYPLITNNSGTPGQIYTDNNYSYNASTNNLSVGSISNIASMTFTTSGILQSSGNSQLNGWKYVTFDQTTTNTAIINNWASAVIGYAAGDPGDASGNRKIGVEYKTDNRLLVPYTVPTISTFSLRKVRNINFPFSKTLTTGSATPILEVGHNGSNTYEEAISLSFRGMLYASTATVIYMRDYQVNWQLARAGGSGTAMTLTTWGASASNYGSNTVTLDMGTISWSLSTNTTSISTIAGNWAVTTGTPTTVFLTGEVRIIQASNAAYSDADSLPITSLIIPS